jgi:glycosyltransferase involved in cell wall biosynthesis
MFLGAVHKSRMNTLVSIIIPAYHLQAQFLATALESVLAQSYSPVEAVLVHDGSKTILQTIDRWNGEKRLTTYRETGRGYIAALNQGIQLARGDYIAFCDSDDLLNRDHVKVLTETLRRFPETGLVFDNLSYLVTSSDSEPDALNGLHELDGRPLVAAERARKLVERGVTLQDVFMENLISGPAFMVRKKVFHRVGLFDDSAFLMNDLHLFYRIGAHFPIRYVDYIGVRKRVHAQNLTTTHPHYEYGVKSLESIRHNYPDVYRRIGKRLFNKKLARKYYRLGLYNEKSGNRAAAKEMFRKAMLARKLSFRYHWGYVRSALLVRARGFRR